jgi:uncharacterized protein
MYRILAIVLGALFTLLLAVVMTMQFAFPAEQKPLAASNVQASTLAADQTPVRSIAVSGDGTANAVPDVIKIDVGVEVVNASLSEARAEAADKMGKVVQKMKDLGIAEKDIQTIDFHIYPQYDQANPPKIVGFNVGNIVRATIRDINKASDIIDQVVAVGATTINSINFTIDNDKPVVAIARENAIADAKAKAEQLAKLAGVTLGPVISISESVGAVPPIPYAQRDMAQGAASAPSTPVQAGQLEVQDTVSVVYSIQ